MKSLKTFMTAGILAVGFAGMANAQTVIKFTGSTAYRANVHTAILHAMGSSNGTSLTSGSFGYVGTTLGGASQAMFVGSVAGNPVIIKTSWSGSEGGLKTVSNNVNVAFLSDSNSANLTPAGAGSLGGLGDVSVPDVAMSDTWQSSSNYNGTYQGVNYAALTESGTSPVGVVPFKWLASPGTTFTNITSQQVRGLYSNGYLAQALFTSGTGDESKLVVAVGRDPDSGTRLTAFAESGVGATATVKQYQPNVLVGGTGASVIVSATGQVITSLTPTPSGLVNGITVNTFNNGFSSGGTLAKAFGCTVSGSCTVAGKSGVTGVTMVGYAGSNDADGNALPAGGVELSFNGVTLGKLSDYNTSTALTEGLYTFWGYEHVYYRSAAVGTTVQTVADAVAAKIHDVDAVVLLKNMKVKRTGDGLTVKQNY